MKTENDNNNAFVIEDLRNAKNTPEDLDLIKRYEYYGIVDFKLTHKLGNNKQDYVLLFELLDKANTASLIGYEEIDTTNHVSEIIIPSEVGGLPVTKIGFSVFGVPMESDSYGTDNLKKVVLPHTVKEIGAWAFGYCSSLKEVDFPEGLTVIEEGAFYECSSIKHLRIPERVSRIAPLAFAGCSRLRSIVVDANNPCYDSRNNCNAIISTKENKLIAGCNRTRVPANVTAIEGAFVNLCGIKKIVIPKQINVIGEYSFKDCTSLEQIVIPDSVFYLGPSAFEGCRRLKKIILPNSIQEINTCTFEGCTDLEEVSLPNKLKVIGQRAFSGCENLSAITIPDSVVSIGQEAFSGCENLSAITIPDSVVSIGANAFQNCKLIERVFIPASVEEIGVGEEDWLDEPVTPWGAGRLLSITVAKDNKHFDSRNNCNAIIDSRTNTLLQGCSETIIPDSVTRIGAGAFLGCTCITSIVIPMSVMIIDDYAFQGCDNLETVVIPSGVTRIGKQAFGYCVGLESISIPDSVQEIGDGAFLGCKDLRKIYIKDTGLLKRAAVLKGVEIIEQEPSLFDGVYVQDTVRNQEFNSEIPLDSDNEWDPEYSFIKHLGPGGKYNDRRFHEKIAEKLLPQTQLVKIESVDFYKILSVIKERLDFGQRDCFFDKVFFEEMSRCVCGLISLKYVKYLNLYNKVGKGQIGNIEFYADCIHSNTGGVRPSKKRLITDNKDDVDVGQGSGMLNGEEEIVEDLFRKGNTTRNLFEYCSSSSKPLIEDEYFAFKYNSRRYKYAYDKALIDFVYGKTFVYEQSSEMQRFNYYLEQLDVCYDEYDNGVTNHFFFIGSSKGSFVARDDYDKYILRASVGIDRNKVEDEKEIRLFLRELIKFVSDVSWEIINRIKELRILQTAEIGSVTQALMRNMSHNIRSHVSNNYTSESAYARLEDNYIKEALNNYVSFEPDGKVFFEGKNLQLPCFIQYLNNRMDYLSELTFEGNAILSTKRFYANIIRELDQERILLNHISGISGFRFRLDMKYNGKPMSEKNDVSVAIPDVLGNQAVFNIIENIIRNTAKHSTLVNNEDVVFTIELIENPEFPEYYCVEIDNGINESDIEKLVLKQNKILNDSILGEDKKLRTYGLGLLEMIVAAAFLRQIEISRINSFEYRFENSDDCRNGNKNLIILKAINKNGSLGYRFFLQKPKEILFVGDYLLDPSKKDMMNKEGVHFFSEGDFTKAMHEGHPFSHLFLLYSDELKDETKTLLLEDNDCKTLLPVRKLLFSRNDIKEVVENVNSSSDILSQLKDFAWKKYMQSMEVDNNDIYIGPVIGRKKFSDCRQVVFANHGTKAKHETYWSNLNRKQLPELWVENLSSYTQGKLPLFAQYSLGEDCTSEIVRYINNIPPQLKMEIYEAYHNKVVVLDERIQRFAIENFEGSSDKEEGGPIPILALFKSTNVIIPETKLDPERFDEASIKEIEKFIRDECDETNKVFLLLHYGILERMYKTEQVITKKLETWAKKAKRVVVTSGRGSHSLQLPDSVCFANLSSVLNAFTENRNKYLINCLINQSRRKNE